MRPRHGAGTVRVEVRVWQDVTNSTAIYVSARAASGSWRTLGLVPLILDDGMNTSGRFRYGDTSLDVPLRMHASGAPVELRVWQHVEDGRKLHVRHAPRAVRGAHSVPSPWSSTA